MDDYSVCSINGQIVDEKLAVLPISSIEAQYGFGVYENIKVRKNIIYFVREHIDRLLHSANRIGRKACDMHARLTVQQTMIPAAEHQFAILPLYLQRNRLQDLTQPFDNYRPRRRSFEMRQSFPCSHPRSVGSMRSAICSLVSWPSFGRP